MQFLLKSPSLRIKCRQGFRVLVVIIIIISRLKQLRRWVYQIYHHSTVKTDPLKNC